MGFFVGMMFGTRKSVQAASENTYFHSVAPKGRGVQLDQLAEGGVWVQNPLHRAQSPGAVLGDFQSEKFFDMGCKESFFMV